MDHLVNIGLSVISAGVLGYLIYALVYPEKF